ncbi:MAG: UvrD-helicase domain-containing protein, partial [Spirochaetales bacterium]|nr:UvrD-helicase domain-containing protein [Spirochaetales bacterium]
PIKNLPLRGFPQGEEGAEDKNLVRRLRAGIETALGLAAVAGDRDFLLEAAALAGEFQDEINQTKRLGKTLSFQDVAELAVEVLKTNLSVRRFYKNRIKYIMIDEFQDNNRLQKELLYLLAEKTSAETPGVPGPEDLNPDKLYFVGDEKQSIYRFRGADVSVFKGLSKELSSCGGRALSLRTNYRSEPDLIAFFNPLFSRVLSSPEEAEDFEAAFESLAPRREEGEKLVPRIELWYFPLPDNDGEEEENPEPEDLLDPQETEAFELARFIRRTVEEKSLPVRKDGKIRPAAYEDFALLLRSNTSQFSYERWFRRLGVPFEVENPCSFFLEAVVNDITAFLRLLLDPQDLFALTTFLRSPLVNLPDDSLSLLLLQNLPDPLGPEGWELMPRESDRNKLRQAWEMRQELLALADRVPHRELIDRIWHEWGYRYFILQDPSYHNYLDFFDYFFALAQGADQQGLSLAAFVDRLIPRLGRAEKAPDLKIMKPPRSGVRIMTIHASKGLEFPVVILANAGNEGRQQNAGSSSCYFSPSLGISFRLNPPGDKAGNPIYNEIRDEEDTRQKAELKRLFYVALTRAESHLIVAGHHNRNKNYFKADSSLDPQTSLLNLFLLGLDFKFGAGIKPENAEVLRPYLKLLSPLPVREAESLSLPVKRRNPAEILAWAKAAPSPEFSLPRRQRGVLDFLRESSPPGLGESGGQRVPLPDPEMDSLIAANHWETLFGSLCHLLLEEALSSDPRPGREKEKEELLSDLGAEDSRALTQAAERLCQGFLKTPLGAKLKGGLEKYCEFDFLLRKEEGAGGLPLFLHGRIDFLARCGKDGPEGETEWIVADFKAGAEKEGSLAFAQLALYREAVGEMFPGYGVRCFVCYLRDGSAEELK